MHNLSTKLRFGLLLSDLMSEVQTKLLHKLMLEEKKRTEITVRNSTLSVAPLIPMNNLSQECLQKISLDLTQKCRLGVKDELLRFCRSKVKITDLTKQFWP